MVYLSNQAVNDQTDRYPGIIIVHPTHDNSGKKTRIQNAATRYRFYVGRISLKRAVKIFPNYIAVRTEDAIHGVNIEIRAFIREYVPEMGGDWLHYKQLFLDNYPYRVLNFYDYQQMADGWLRKFE